VNLLVAMLEKRTKLDLATAIYINIVGGINSEPAVDLAVCMAKLRLVEYADGYRCCGIWRSWTFRRDSSCTLLRERIPKLKLVLMGLLV